jgi:hypothetical protein
LGNANLLNCFEIALALEKPLLCPELGALGLKMGRNALSRLSMVILVLLLAGTSAALAQTPNDLTRMFGAPQRPSIQTATRSEWSKISRPEIGCINNALRQHGAKIETLIQRGVMPSDSRIGTIRSDCQQSSSGSKYVVAGLSVGSRVQFDSSDYREYKCSPSEQFDGFTWCQKTRQERGIANVTYSMLHSQDGTLVYVNRFQEPAFFGRNEADQAIRQYSSRNGEKAQIKRLPPQRGIPEGIIATWGKVVLEPLDNDSIKTLAEGRSPKKGYLIDFVGNFARSAKEGLPIYRISGNAGFVWVASFDPIGRGILRVAAVDPSATQASPLPNEARGVNVQVTPEPQSAEAEATSIDANAAREQAETAAEDAKADAEVASNETETAKRDAQLAKAEVDRLRAEAAKLNSALERLQRERSEARVMEFVVDAAIIILIALIAIISSILLVNRRKAIAGKADGVAPQANLSEMVSPVLETQRASDGGASEGTEARDTILTSPEPAQFLPNATAPKSQNGSGASDVTSTSEERVCLPI